jgi:hypothetical protein
VLLPVIVALALGFFAAWRYEFTPRQALALHRMVLLHASPLLMFAGTVTIKHGTLTGSLGLATAIVAAMVGAYLVPFTLKGGQMTSSDPHADHNFGMTD